MQEITVIAGEKRCRLNVRGSKFIATAAPVFSTSQAEAFVSKVKKEFHNATHNVYAWVLGPDKEEKCSDDGEPANTAGQPVLSAIRNKDLTNTAIVVTRYFGGTKLGTGGLIRAYGTAAREVLAQVTLEKLIFVEEMWIHVPYDHVGNALNWLKGKSIEIEDMEYDTEGAVIKIKVEDSKATGGELKDFLKDEIKIEVRGSSFIRR